MTDIWTDPETHQLYTDKGIMEIVFPKKFKNIPFRKSPIYEISMPEGYLHILMNGAYIHGFLFDDDRRAVCGQISIDKLNPSHNRIEWMWKDVTCKLFSSVSLNLKNRILPGDTLRISLLSPNVINPDKSIMNMGIRRFEKIRMR